MLERSIDELLDQLRRVFPPGPFLDRRLGRAFAFQALYEMDLAHHTPAEVLERLATTFGEPATIPYPTEILRAATTYAHGLVRGVLTHRAEIDALIHQRAPLW